MERQRLLQQPGALNYTRTVPIAIGVVELLGDKNVPPPYLFQASVGGSVFAVPAAVAAEVVLGAVEDAKGRSLPKTFALARTGLG